MPSLSLNALRVNPLVALPVVAVAAIDPAGWLPFTTFRWFATSSLILIGLAWMAFTGLEAHRTSMIAWVLFLTWAFTTALFGVDGISAWIGTPHRHLGFVAWVLFAVAFLVGQNLGRAKLAFAWSLAAGAVLLGVASVLDTIGWWFLDLDFEGGRVSATFGNPAFVGAAAVFFVFAVGGIAVDAGGDQALRRFAAFGAIAALVALILSESRSALIALLAATALAAWAARESIMLNARRYVLTAVMGSLVVVGVIVVTGFGGRIVGSFGSDGGFASRTDEWAVGLQAAADNPLGVGPEGYRIVFPDAVNDAYQQRYGRSVLPDRAHSGPIDVAVTLGIPGLLLWAIVMATVAFRSAKAASAGSPAIKGMALACAAFFVHQLLLFPLAEFDAVVWLTAGLLVSLAPGPERLYSPNIRSLQVLGGAAALAAVLATVAGIQDVRAGHLAQESRELVAADRLPEALQAVNQAVAWRPDQFTYRLAQYSAALSANDLEAATDALNSALDLSPGDPILRQRRAELATSVAAATETVESQQAAVDAWYALTQSDPTNSTAWFSYAVAVAPLEPDMARTAWTRAAALSPGLVAPLVNLAILEILAGDLAAAEAAIDQALRLDPEDVQALEIKAQIIEAVGE